MEELNIGNDEQLQEELEPKEIAPITEVTGASAGGGGDERGQIVWGDL